MPLLDIKFYLREKLEPSLTPLSGISISIPKCDRNICTYVPNVLGNKKNKTTDGFTMACIEVQDINSCMTI